MLSRVNTVSFEGITAKNVDVQVSIAKGLPVFNIVGLADKSVSESKERLRAAFYFLGLSFPAGRLIVNLSPANLAKEGSYFDLPIALAILGAMEIIPTEEILHYIAMGELALDGEIKPVNGILAGAIFAVGQQKGFIFPNSQLNEVYLTNNTIDVLPLKNLKDIIYHFSGDKTIVMSAEINVHKPSEEKDNAPNIGNIKGHETAKRALCVAASGKHNLLMIGTPGSGKSLLANSMVGILPPLSKEEALEVSLIYSVAGELHNQCFINKRPYRAPHHSASLPSLVGGGRIAKPGEITLAHHGVLFLDELAEFNKSLLDSLRQPIETGTINIARVNSHVTYPAKFQLIAAMNPCKCGYFGDESRSCSKAPRCAEQYQSKISGPILDRIDLIVEVPQVSLSELHTKVDNMLQEKLKNQILKAREKQHKRYRNYNINLNSEATSEILEEVANLNMSAKSLLSESMLKFKFSTRAYYRLIKLARTIADIDNQDIITKSHMAEAISYRKINHYQKILPLNN